MRNAGRVSNPIAASTSLKRSKRGGSQCTRLTCGSWQKKLSDCMAAKRSLAGGAER